MNPAEFVRLDPGAAIRYMKSRGVMLPGNYYAQAGAARMMSFTVTRIVGINALQLVLDSLTDAMRTGENFASWKSWALEQPSLATLPKGQLDNVFRTNMQGAYHRGIYQRQAEVRDSRPFLMYDAINDSRTRPSHRAMDGFIARWDDPIWKTHRPPMGFRCRCTLITLTEEQAKARGLGERGTPNVQPDPGWDYDRADGIAPGVKRAKARAEAKPVAKKSREPRKPKSKPVNLLDWYPNRAMYPIDDWPRVGGQLGSNPGGTFESPDGSRFYVKFPSDPDHARAEVVGMSFYSGAGLDNLDNFLVTKGGKVGVATKWRDDLRPLTPEEMDNPTGRLREDLAVAYIASVATKNWDVVGLAFDNLLVSTRTGRLVVADTGGSFTFRAQGGAKPYDANLDELRTLLDQTINPQAARAFREIANDPILLERMAYKALAGKSDFTLEVSMRTKRIGEWGDGMRDRIMERVNALKSVFDVDKTQRPKDFGAFYNRLASAHGGTRIVGMGPDPDGNNLDGVQVNAAAIELTGRLMKDVEAEFKRVGVEPFKVRQMLSDWSGSSSSGAGAVMKLWAADRFGAKVTHHDRAASAARSASKDAASWLKAAGLTKAAAFAALDVEYEFTQYMLRRTFGFDTIPVRRAMSEDELRTQFSGGRYTPNAVTSTAHPVGRFQHFRSLLIDARVEDFMKLYWQGAKYVPFGSIEREFIMIGRARPAREVE